MFTGGRHKYTFKNLCLEEQGLSLEDGTTKLFLSTKGTMDDISKPLKIFLDYVDGKLPADTLMQEIDAEVNIVRNCDEWRREYMTLALEMDRKYAEGILKNALESVRNLVAKTDMSPKEAINLLGYDKELSAKLMPLLK